MEGSIGETWEGTGIPEGPEPGPWRVQGLVEGRGRLWNKEMLGNNSEHLTFSRTKIPEVALPYDPAIPLLGINLKKKKNRKKEIFLKRKHELQ